MGFEKFPTQNKRAKQGWRGGREKNKPVTEEHEGKSVEREPRIPDRLFRQIGTEDLYLLWRDHELPLQPFRGSPGSKVEPNSVGNFWFTQPLSLPDPNEMSTRASFSRLNNFAYLITEPTKWQKPPEYVQESEMSFVKYQDVPDTYETTRWSDVNYYSVQYGSVPEIHTGNRLPVEELKICITPGMLYMFSQEMKVLQQLQVSGASGSNDEAWFMERLTRLRSREFGEIPGVGEKRNKKRSQKQLTDKEFMGRLEDFYRWALSLPVIPESAIPPLPNAADAVKKATEQEFLNFYDKLP